jgi:hypothetical protein
VSVRTKEIKVGDRVHVASMQGRPIGRVRGFIDGTWTTVDLEATKQRVTVRTENLRLLGSQLDLPGVPDLRPPGYQT